MHEWKLWRAVHVKTDIGSTYDVYHFYCIKCGKFKKNKIILSMYVVVQWPEIQEIMTIEGF